MKNFQDYNCRGIGPWARDPWAGDPI